MARAYTAIVVPAELPTTTAMPARSVRGRKRYPGQPLHRDEIDRMLRRCPRRYANGIRLRALIVVLWRTGLRVAEAAALELRDLDRKAGTVRVREGKGGRSRTVPMDAGAWSVLDAWIEQRRIDYHRGTFVFSTRTGSAVATSYVRRSIRELARKAGIRTRVHPHAFRHSYASELAREGVGVQHIRVLLGHSTLAVTSRYLETVGTTAELVAVVQARPAWR